MVESAVTLLAKQGLQGTSFSEVIEASGAPRGSLYHHFPGGKDELVGSALDVAAASALTPLEQLAGESAETIAKTFLATWREVLSRSQFRAGCAVLAVAVATDSPELLDHTASVFRSWRGRLAQLLSQGGLTSTDAARMAATLVASTEGAVVLSRAEQSMEPFDLVADQMLEQVRRMSRPPAKVRLRSAARLR
jgi:AcrR family transcriptional regulator